MMGITAMNNGVPTIATKSEPADLQASLKKQFNDSGITVVNHATGGTSSSLMNELDGMDGNGAPFAQRIQSSKAAIIIDNHAINDMYAGESVSDYIGYLNQWVDAVMAAHKIPVLEEPNPTCDSDHPNLADYVAAMDSVARQRGVAIIGQYQYILSLPNWQLHMDATCMYPDETMDSVKAQKEFEVIGPIVKNIIGG